MEQNTQKPDPEKEKRAASCAVPPTWEVVAASTNQGEWGRVHIKHYILKTPCI